MVLRFAALGEGGDVDSVGENEWVRKLVPRTLSFSPFSGTEKNLP